MTRRAGLSGFSSSGSDARRPRTDRRTRTNEWVGDGLEVKDGKMAVLGREHVKVTERGVEINLDTLLAALQSRLDFLDSKPLKGVQSLIDNTTGTVGLTLGPVSAVASPNDELATIAAKVNEIIAKLR